MERLFKRMSEVEENYKLLYQLPTGGGKTVIFSEMARRYIEKTGKKVLILTHRIELSVQTSNMLTGFGVKNIVINSDLKHLVDEDQVQCFVAMVETLNNRLQEKSVELKNIGLVIIDEAHYNSFRKLFKYYEHCFILGVTATPLSSNVKLPMNNLYDELIEGRSIQYLIDQGFLANAKTYSYNVGLGSLKRGQHGDYTVKSSELLYSREGMVKTLLQAYQERALDRKTLIFNPGIKTSHQVYAIFKRAGHNVRHIDSTQGKKERVEVLKWFKETKNAILTSVGILTTGFDEPTIQTIIINRATRSLGLYFQMIGRGSRVMKDKDHFDIVDLGNNVARFGLWQNPVDWQEIFHNPEGFMDGLVSDEDIERMFKYDMPDSVRRLFAKTEDIDFNIRARYKELMKAHEKPTQVLEESMDQHLKMIMENSDDLKQGFALCRILEDDINDRIRHYCYCLAQTTPNFRQWLEDDYRSRLKKKFIREFSLRD